MTRKAQWKIAAASLMVATALAGCSSLGLHSRASAGAEQPGKPASFFAGNAEKALATRNVALAVPAAESAVGMDGNNAAYRVLLGRAYLMSGRFESARTAFGDAMTLGNREPRTIVSLALVNVAMGNLDGARSLLSSNMDVLPAADYGLAVAMAGAPDEAIRVLSQAIHDPSAGSKERQNLAYAYALAGRWSDARTMAAQDMAPIDAARRVMEWAQSAQPGAEHRRVIALLGVQPVANDTGLPSALALNGGASSTVDLAYAPKPPAEAEAPQAPRNDATVQPEPAITNAPIQSASAQIRFAPSSPVVQSLPAAHAKPVPTIRASRSPARLAVAAPHAVPAKPAAPVAQQVAFRPVAATAGATPWVVQLGAFDTPEIAKSSWQRIVARNVSLREFPIVTSTVAVRGRTFHRLAVAGFGNRDGAERLCASIRGQGGACFVRIGGGAAATQKWATAAKPRQVAMR